VGVQDVGDLGLAVSTRFGNGRRCVGGVMGGFDVPVAPRDMAIRAKTPWKMRTMRIGEMNIMMRFVDWFGDEAVVEEEVGEVVFHVLIE